MNTSLSNAALWIPLEVRLDLQELDLADPGPIPGSLQVHLDFQELNFADSSPSVSISINSALFILL